MPGAGTQTAPTINIIDNNRNMSTNSSGGGCGMAGFPGMMGKCCPGMNMAQVGMPSPMMGMPGCAPMFGMMPQLGMPMGMRSPYSFMAQTEAKDDNESQE